MYYPKLFSWLPNSLLNVRRSAMSADVDILPAVNALRQKAELMLQEDDLSVTYKSDYGISLSGDPHVYTSLSSYYWPVPGEPESPWCYKDGQYNNLEIEKYDFLNWERMIKRIVTLTLAWWMTDNSRYADSAINQVRVWFLNSDTLMYPNLEYAQTIPNYKKGSSAGIIDVNQIDQLINSLGLLEMCTLWTSADTIGMKKWCQDMSNWLLHSESGKKENENENNHGTYYDKILLALSSYSGDSSIVYRVLNSFPEKRIYKQIDVSGEMPYEMKRANAYHYLQWSLSGLVSIAEIASNRGINIWDLKTENSGSILDALDWAAGYIKGEKIWNFQAKFDPLMNGLFEVIWRSSIHHEGKYKSLLENFLLPKQDASYMKSHHFNVIYPRRWSQILYSNHLINN